MFWNAARNILVSGAQRVSTSASMIACRLPKVASASPWRELSMNAPAEESTAKAMEASSQKSVVAAAVAAEDEVDKLYRHLDLEVRGHDPAVLRSYKYFVLESARHLEIPVVKTWEPKKTHDRRDMLKSAFSHRKHLVQYEARTYYQIIMLEKVTGSTADTFLEYIQRNIPEGVAMKVTKREIRPLPEHLKQRPPQLQQSEEPNMF